MRTIADSRHVAVAHSTITCVKQPSRPSLLSVRACPSFNYPIFSRLSYDTIAP